MYQSICIPFITENCINISEMVLIDWLQISFSRLVWLIFHELGMINISSDHFILPVQNKQSVHFSRPKIFQPKSPSACVLCAVHCALQRVRHFNEYSTIPELFSLEICSYSEFFRHQFSMHVKCKLKQI